MHPDPVLLHPSRLEKCCLQANGCKTIFWSRNCSTKVDDAFCKAGFYDPIQQRSGWNCHHLLKKGKHKSCVKRTLFCSAVWKMNRIQYFCLMMYHQCSALDLKPILRWNCAWVNWNVAPYSGSMREFSGKNIWVMNGTAHHSFPQKLLAPLLQRVWIQNEQAISVHAYFLQPPHPISTLTTVLILQCQQFECGMSHFIYWQMLLLPAT